MVVSMLMADGESRLIDEKTGSDDLRVADGVGDKGRRATDPGPGTVRKWSATLQQGSPIPVRPS